MIVPPRRPTWKRWKDQAFRRTSVLRSMEYELLPTLALKGRVLDVGGGKKAHYNSLLKVEGLVEGINISPAMDPVHVADANQPWPTETASYDMFISFNTFEHIERDVFAVGEALRSLKPGGQFHFIVPFLYRVHASPSDYHRHTAAAWENILAAHGIPPEHQRIEPLMWDSMATAFSFIELTRLRRLKPLFMLVGVLRCLGMKGDRLPESVAKHWQDWALGYYISGTKPAA